MYRHTNSLRMIQRHYFGKHVPDIVGHTAKLAAAAKDSTTDMLIDQSVENANNIFEKMAKNCKYDCDVTITHNLGPVTIEYKRAACHPLTKL